MEEHYTFSRALHLMRYAGAKMQSTLWRPHASGAYLHVRNGELYFTLTGDHFTPAELDSYEIMGSWVEVVE